MNRASDDDPLRQLAELRDSRISERGHYWRDQITERVVFAHDVRGLETLVGQE
jgi:hypothetical protein